MKSFILSLLCTAFCGCLMAQSNCQPVKCAAQQSAVKAVNYTYTFTANAQAPSSKEAISCQKQATASKTKAVKVANNVSGTLAKSSCEPCPLPCPPVCKPLCQQSASQKELSKAFMVLGKYGREPIAANLK